MSERGAFQFELSAKKRKRASLWSDVSGQAREAKGDRIEIGSLSTCSILLNDPVVQEVHAVIRWDAGAFSIEDRGSATGTYVDGLEVREPCELRNGDQIVIGVSRLTVALAGPDGQPLRTSDGRPLLRIALEENAFFFAPKTSALFKKRSDEERAKEEALATKDQWVYAETRFGRSRMLFVANWIAGGATVLILPLLLWTALGEHLVDPGALSSVHAAVVSERGLDCGTCHDSFDGSTAERCGECHAALLQRWRHPFGSASADGATAADLAFAETGGCASCHREHQGPTMLQPEAAEICRACHAEQELEPEALRAALAERDGRVERPASVSRPRAIDYNEFSHATHLKAELGIACGDCHVRAELDSPGRAREFQAVAFETCMTCHEKGKADALARWPGLAAFQWEVHWHGSDDPAKCLQCHERLHEGELRSDETLDVEPLAFTLQRRDHAEHLGLDGGANRCGECHASGTVPAASVEGAPFWHALHMRELASSTTAEQQRVSGADCLACHTEVRGSTALASLSDQPYYAGSATERCGTCHVDAASGQPLPLALAPPPPGSARTRTDFPHAAHLAVEGGCYACHSFELPEESLPFQARPRTEPDADCLRCHADHDHIAGGTCAACHGFEDERWRAGPPEDPRMHSAFRGTSLLGDWTSGAPVVAATDGGSPQPAASSFDHFSAGHRESTEQGRCIDCHEGREGSALRAAESVLAVPLPLESDAGCRACHVLERRRFHWE